MAQIREELALIDKFSAQFTKFIAMAEKASGTAEDVRGSLSGIETASASAAGSMDRFTDQLLQADRQIGRVEKSGNALSGTIRRMMAAVASVQTVQWLVNTSDQISQIDARLKRMTGSAEASVNVSSWFGSHGDSLVIRNWVGVSLALQIAAAALLIWASVKVVEKKRGR